MATIISHAVVALAIGKALSSGKEPGKYYALGALCAIVPDADAVGYWLGVPYDSLFGHRGFTHSFFFAFLLATVVTAIFFRNRFPGKSYSRLWFYFFLATAMHPIVDAMTSGGLGVAFFSPFSNQRYFFSFRPIKVCSIGFDDLFTGRGVRIFRSEFVWLWVPALVVAGISAMLKNPKNKAASNS